MTPKATTPFLVGLAAGALLLAACGGGSPAAAGSTNSPTTAPTSGGGDPQGRTGGGAPGAGRIPGTSGLVAEVDGRTLQVQSATSQTAVTWTAATRFTAEVAATRSDVKVGVCVMVRSDAGTGQGTNATPPTAVTAESVSITPAQGGRCDNGFFGRGGGQGRPPGAGQGTAARPSGAPTTGAPGGTAGRRFGGFGGAFGIVTAVGPTGFTVSSTDPAALNRGAEGGTASPSPSAAAPTRVVTVTTTAATTYTQTRPATGAAATVGTCVTALGRTDQTGAVAATSIAIRKPVNGSCFQGFGRPGQGTATTNG